MSNRAQNVAMAGNCNRATYSIPDADVDTPQPGGNGVHLNRPQSGKGRSPTGLSDYQDSQGLSGLSGTNKESRPNATECLSLPWEEFLVWAFDSNREHLEDLETEAGLEASWQLDTPLFKFTHLVWSRPNLGDDARHPAKLFSRVEKSLKRWTKRKKADGNDPLYKVTGDPWEEWFCLSREDAKTEFLDLWPKFRFPFGQSPLDAAVMLARRGLLLIPPAEVCERRFIEPRGRPEGYCLFLSVCGHLQAMMGNRSILLPQEKLATAMRVRGRTISRWRQWAVADDLLKQTAPPGRRRAGEYRFDIEGWETLEQKAPPGTAEGFGDSEQ